MELIPMTPMKITSLPDRWHTMRILERCVFLQRTAFDLITHYLLSRRDSMIYATTEFLVTRGLILINLANHYYLSMTVRIDADTFAFHVNLFLYKNNRQIRASNIGYCDDKFCSKSYNHYEDMMAELIVVSRWAVLNHIIVDN
jgi:hypothetical protein